MVCNATVLLSVLSLLLSPSVYAESDSCKLPAHKPLTVAYTTPVSNRIKTRILLAASKRHYYVHFASLRSINNYLDADAIITPGGHDIDIDLYLSKIPESERDKELAEFKKEAHRGRAAEARDLFEFDFFQKYFSDPIFSNTPGLGICYGMQMLAISNGIPLEVDLKDDLNIPARYNIDDKIHAETGSLIASIVGRDVFEGFEEHHQAVNIEAFREFNHPDVQITATSNGGRIPETMEYRSRPSIGVQFHPEYSPLAVSDAVFGWWLEKACKKRLARE
jgi:gamma-glutamyl-gamma-aminobutyrate hydrolase PuuD